MLQGGQRIDCYKIRRFLDRGGTSEVYLVDQDNDPAPLVLKLLREDLRQNQGLHARIYNEYLVLKDLHLPGVAQIVGQGEFDGRPYLILEYLPGGTLADRPRPRSPEEVRDLGVLLARTLIGVHAHGIIHRDLKPQNILFAATGAPRLGDFSHAKAEGAKASGTAIDHSTETGAFLGTAAYAPPEQLLSSKTVATAADVYALGVLLFEQLTDARPFTGDDVQELARVRLTKKAPLLSSVLRAAPPPLTALLAQMLDSRPEARPSAAAVAETLERMSLAPARSRRWLLTTAAPAGMILLGAAAFQRFTAPDLDHLYETLEEDLEGGTIADAQRTLAAAQHLVEATRATPAVVARHAYKAADLAKAQGLLQAAAHGYETSLPVWRSGVTPLDHRHCASCANELGDIYRHLGQWEQAMTLHQEALHHQEILLSAELNLRPQLAYSRYRVGLLHADRQEFDQARAALQSAADLLDVPHPDAALYRVKIAELLSRLDASSVAAAQRAFELGQKLPGGSKRCRMAFLRTVDRLAQVRGDAPLFQQALAGKRALWREDPAHGLWAHELLETLMRGLGRDPSQRPLAEEAHDVLRSMAERGQWQDDVHVSAWQKELAAIDAHADRVLPG